MKHLFFTKRLAPWLLPSLLCACAAMVSSEPAVLTPFANSQIAAPIVLARDAEIKLSTGYSRTLAAGSRWRSVGSLPQGAVFARVDGVFSVEGRHVHEAYLVIQNGSLQGFYLPGEAQFSPLSTSLPLSFGAP